MRILILGAGATGGYFGARAAEAGADITFLVRPRRAAQLANGLTLRSPRGNLTRPVTTVQADTLQPPYGAVVLTCKAYDLDDAIAAIAPAVGPGTAILPLLNGMRHLDTLDARFGPGAVLGGRCQIAATLDPDGAIRHLNDHAALSLGERDGSLSPRAEALAAAFAPAGGRASTDILQDMWEKWVFLSVLAGLTCLMRAAVGDIAVAGGTDIAHGLFDEAAAIAAAAGHPPRPASIERMRTAIAAPGSTFTASMLRDIERGHPTEAAHIIGDLIARGTPDGTRLLRTAYVHLRAYEARRAREAG